MPHICNNVSTTYVINTTFVINLVTYVVEKCLRYMVRPRCYICGGYIYIVW